MERDPKIDVKIFLRQEVNFCCPVESCGNPYLTWHHFDPRWEKEKHHNSAGMIALCREHHDKADAGAFTINQLRNLKSGINPNVIAGKFDWMRNKLLCIAGSTFTLNPYKILRVKGIDLLYFSRSIDGSFLMNINFTDVNNKTRFLMEENVWNFIETPKDFECPPSGRSFKIRFEDGDKLDLEFFELEDHSTFKKRYNRDFPDPSVFPITAVELTFKHNPSGSYFTPSKFIAGPFSGSGMFANMVACVFNI